MMSWLGWGEGNGGGDDDSAIGACCERCWRWQWSWWEQMLVVVATPFGDGTWWLHARIKPRTTQPRLQHNLHVTISPLPSPTTTPSMPSPKQPSRPNIPPWIKTTCLEINEQLHRHTVGKITDPSGLSSSPSSASCACKWSHIPSTASGGHAMQNSQ